MTAMKRGRGRPRKNESKANETPKVSSKSSENDDNNNGNNDNIGIIKSAVVEATRRRPRRTAARKVTPDPEAELGVQLDKEDEDEEFVPEVDVDEETQKPDKRRKTRSPKTSIEINSSKVQQRGSNLERKGKIIRALKDLSSARDKIERIYGLNEHKLLRLAKVKEGFEPYLFCFPSEMIQRDSPYYVDCKPPCSIDNVYDKVIPSTSSLKFHDIDVKELDQIFTKNKKEHKIIINESETALQSEQSMEFPVLPYGKRHGFVYNSGGFITDMAWLSQDESDDQYLAVALSQYFERPSDSHLRMFESESHTSCIEIFRLNTNTLKFTKLQTLAHSFGEIWNLKWHEGCEKNGVLGVLAFVCQNGSFKLTEVTVPNDDSHVVRFFDEASLSVSMPNTNITCYDFLSPTSIICGFKNGFVAEFDLTDPEFPSYYHKMHDSYVISICVASSETERTTVGTLSVDGYFYIFDAKEIFTSKLEVTRFRGTNIIPIAYLPQLYAFVHSDGTNSLKTVVPRAAFGMHTIALQETTIVSVGTSRLHPLVLNGSSDGNIAIDNVSRRVLTGIKNSSVAHCSLRLWKWEYSKREDKYRLNHNYEIYKPSINEISGVKIDAHGVNISCIKWNETSAAGQFYAFANSAGLLTIEKLGND
ncbi:ZYRO0F09746p [Zygosaccharomyces rouxii]|uniref:ZYRO0F09746p n=1 Tax=Zygosaccharomyces rouxii (strain ATCC 2623 / CBS 732 / NBRC 1130 / NCYC 568 / NRRL Y-229) TaxID=559307 RepID=C5DY27_ZYGRC|nr:uncharacterized protein ZYRO0F09746g [Zygosaccharomyces rouxii]KAH9199446.1 hypothetical protein LQ764DRAFT_130514 [Zygosaccharomyces rouxii]CAR28688.1 ZYRO0F09746p [Zygosaccharomyces rouxii]